MSELEEIRENEECCCGHDHHEHEECGCGHDHHEHEEGCCGHDHHEHEEESCCGHGHHEQEECCCEHDHHEHEECCCGHDHHEQEECCCGHDHHEHEEGCNCGCGHDHDEHEHEHQVPGYRLFETHNHEGAAVCSFEKSLKMPAADARPAMKSACEGLENWLNSQGAIIGHIKGFIKENGLTTTFSTVGAGLNMTEHDGVGCEVGFASIVFGVDEEALEEKVIEEFSVLV